MMTKNNFKKQAIRERMATTGEVFSVAKRHLDSQTSPLLSPWSSFNSAIGGFQAGKLYTIGGRPGNGMTTFAIQLAAHFASTKQYCEFLTLESSRKEILARFSSHLTQIPLDRIVNHRKTSELSEEESLKIAFAKTQLTGSIVVSMATFDYLGNNFFSSLAQKENLKVLIVEDLQLLAMDMFNGSVPEAAKMLKKIAVGFNIPVIVTARMNRTQATKPETVFALTKGMDTELSATSDVIIVLEAANDYDRLDVKVLKNRGKDCKDFSLAWNRSTVTLTDLSAESN